MPPHYDSMDGPVLKAAMKALDSGDVRVILPFVPEEDEAEVAEAFEKVTKVRAQSPEAKDVADKHFFEAVVRIHRAGEGAPFAGLKPAGLGHGPVVPVAEKAIEDGSAEGLVKLLTDTIEEQIRERFEHVTRLKEASGPKGSLWERHQRDARVRGGDVGLGGLLAQALRVRPRPAPRRGCSPRTRRLRRRNIARSWKDSARKTLNQV